MIYIYITYFFYLLIFTTLLKKVYTNRNSKALSILCIFLFAIIDGTVLTHKTPGKMSIPLSEVHAIRYRSPHNPLKKSIFFES